MVGVSGSWIQLAFLINKTPILGPSKTSCSPCGSCIDLDGLSIKTGVSRLYVGTNSPAALVMKWILEIPC
jgi:hypothetical protein